MSQPAAESGIWVKKFSKHCESVKLLDPEGKNILLASRNKIYQSSDFGSSWDSLFAVPINYLVSDIIYNPDSSILCGISNYKSHALYRYDMQGKCLTKVLDDAAESHPLITTESDSIFFAVGYRGSMYRSNDYGKAWSLISECTIPNLSEYANYYVCSANSCILKDHRRFILGFVIPSRIIISDDTCKIWKVVANPREIENGSLPQITKGTEYGEFFCCANNNISNNFFYSVLHSTNSGDTWRLISTPSSLCSQELAH